jgi:hypothetical protein
MTYKNAHPYIDVLPKFVKRYNDTVHSATGMGPPKVTDSDILVIWNKMRARHSPIRRAPDKFKIGHVRISKEKLKFAKGGEQNYTTEIFKIQKVVSRIARPVYELVDLLGKHIDGQFYGEELVPVIVPKSGPTPYLKYCVRGFETVVSNILSAGLLILQNSTSAFQLKV